MAIITKIRNRSGLLFGLIALAIILFLFMDVFSGNNSPFASRNTSVGKVDGEPIDNQEYNTRVEEGIQNYMQQTQQTQVDDNTRGMLSDQMWNEIVKDRLYQSEYSKIGLVLGDGAKEKLIFSEEYANPEIKKSFTDPNTKQNRVVEFLKNISKQEPKIQDQWNKFEQFIYKNAVEEEYQTMVAAGSYSTSLEAKYSNDENGKNADVSYVILPYAEIPDSTVKPTDEDYQTYYEAHKKELEQKVASRTIKMVVFDVKPSADDDAAMNKKVAEMAAAFASTSDDSAFVAANNQGSGEPFMNTFKPVSAVNSIVKDTLLKVAPGTIVGPYREGNDLKLTKVIARSTRPDSVGARHILFSYAGAERSESALSKEDAKKKADSVFAILKQDTTKFAALAKQFGSDGTKDQGGELGKFTEGNMTKVFNDYCFTHSKGSLDLIETPFGYHIVNVNHVGSPAPAIKYATVGMVIMPSSATRDKIFSDADAFRSNSKNEADFENLAKKKNFSVRELVVKQSDRNLSGYSDTRAGIRDIFDAEKEGSVLVTGKDLYLVAIVTNIREAGIPALEDVKKEIEPMVIRDVKAKQLLEKAGKASGSLDQIAAALKTTVKAEPGLKFAMAMFNQEGSRELTVTGRVFGSAAGKTLKPLKGEAGVYIVRVNSFTDAPAIADMKSVKDQLLMTAKGQIQNMMLEALKGDKVEDTRYNFY